MTTLTLEIPDHLYQHLRRQAQVSQRSVNELAQATLSRFLPAMIEVEEDLPPALHSELQAMEQLSDVALWALARGQMGEKERVALTELGEVQEERRLTAVEQNRQNDLLTQYDEMLLRRAHTAVLLQARGHDLSDTTLLQFS